MNLNYHDIFDDKTVDREIDNSRDVIRKGGGELVTDAGRRYFQSLSVENAREYKGLPKLRKRPFAVRLAQGFCFVVVKNGKVAYEYGSKKVVKRTQLELSELARSIGSNQPALPVEPIMPRLIVPPVALRQESPVALRQMESRRIDPPAASNQRVPPADSPAAAGAPSVEISEALASAGGDDQIGPGVASNQIAPRVAPVDTLMAQARLQNISLENQGRPFDAVFAHARQNENGVTFSQTNVAGDQPIHNVTNHNVTNNYTNSEQLDRIERNIIGEVRSVNNKVEAMTPFKAHKQDNVYTSPLRQPKFTPGARKHLFDSPAAAGAPSVDTLASAGGDDQISETLDSPWGDEESVDPFDVPRPEKDDCCIIRCIIQ